MNNRLTAREQWAAMLGYEGLYEVSSMGRVKSLKRVVNIGTNKREVPERILNPIVGTRGYYVINLTAHGRRKQVFLHKVVLEAFIGPRPEGMEACHNNGKKLDCYLDNLRWDTRSCNHKDKRIHGTWQVGEAANNVKLTERTVREIRQRGLTATQAQKEFGMSKTNARRIVNYVTWPHVYAK